MDRSHIQYQETNIDDVDETNDYNDSDEDINETTAMMADNHRDNNDDLGYEYGDKDDEKSTNKQGAHPNSTAEGNPDPGEPSATEGDPPADPTPGEDSAEDAPGRETIARSARDAEIPARDHEVPVGVGEETQPDVAVDIPDDHHMERPSPPSYGEPPSYDDAMRTRQDNPVQDVEPAEDLEWDQDEHVEPTKLTHRHSQDGVNCDGIELEQVTSDPGTLDVERGLPEPETSVADTSFSTPASYGQPSVPHVPTSEPLGSPTSRPDTYLGTEQVDNSSSSRLPAVKFSDVSRRECSIYVISLFVAICALLLIILLPLSFSYIEYYQFGMRKGRISKVVEYAKEIYDMGQYVIGPGKTFKHYPATAHHVDYDRIGLFTTDRIILEASISFQYFIKQDELGLIEQKYDRSYTDTIKSVAEAAFKNKAATYSNEEYFSERGKIEQGIHDALRLKLGGNCCPSRDECIRLGTCHLCSDDQATCNKGYHINVQYFQFKQLFIPKELTQKQLNVQLMSEGNEEAVHVQGYQVYVKETEALTEKVRNAANEITSNGTAQAQLILKQGNAQANAIRESAHNRGLKLLYETLNIANDEHKASLHWLRTIERHQNLISGISFKDYIALIQGLTDDD